MGVLQMRAAYSELSELFPFLNSQKIFFNRTSKMSPTDVCVLSLNALKMRIEYGMQIPISLNLRTWKGVSLN